MGNPSALVNGVPADILSIHDRGLLYGDGVFETLAVKGERPLDWERHLRRLRRGCERLFITPPAPETLSEDAALLCEGAERGVLKIIVTRGPGGRGYRPLRDESTTRIVSLHPWPAHPPRYYDQGIAATICATRLARNPLLAGIKHLNRLEQVLARAEWKDEYQEGLMLDTEGWPIEGAMSNLFIIRDDALATPDLANAGVAGIVRERILETAPNLNIETRVRELTMADVESADGLFFCNSVIGIWPVRVLAGRRYSISPLAARLMDALGLPARDA